MSEKNTRGTVIDAKQAIFDKIFSENQSLREERKELQETLRQIETLSREREEQHKRFELLEETVLKTVDLVSMAVELRRLLAREFAIPEADLTLIRDPGNFLLPEKFLSAQPYQGKENRPEIDQALNFIEEKNYRQLFSDGRPKVFNQPDRMPDELRKLVSLDPNQIGSFAFIPLVSRERAIGLLSLGSRDQEKFVPGVATDAVESLGRKLATLIENNLLFAQLQKMSRTDQLTGLYNRRCLEEMLPLEFSRAQRYQQALSLIMIDLDDFKTVNDSYGHPAGDRILAETGRLISDNLRRHDIGIRYGGDEFCVIMPSTNLEQGRVVLEKLRSLAEAAAIPVNDEKTLPIKMSLGLAAYPETPVTSGEGLKKAADEQLYEDKVKRKNAKKL